MYVRKSLKARYKTTKTKMFCRIEIYLSTILNNWIYVKKTSHSPPFPTPRIGLPCHFPYLRYQRFVVRPRDNQALWHPRVTKLSFACMVLHWVRFAQRSSASTNGHLIPNPPCAGGQDYYNFRVEIQNKELSSLKTLCFESIAFIAPSIAGFVPRDRFLQKNLLF